MMSWWPAEGNAEDIQNRNDGILQNGTGFASGMVGQGFSLDGTDDFVDVSDSANLKPPLQITVDAWVKGSVLPSIHYFIVAKSGPGGESGYELGITPDGLVRFTVLAGDAQPFGDAVGVTDVLDGQFHHIAGTYNQLEVHVYVDGVLEGSDPFSSAMVHSSDPLHIGSRQHSLGNFFNGTIDEVEIFARALSDAEIQSIFDAGSDGKCQYSNKLFEGSDHSDGIVNLNEKVTARAETNDPSVDDVTFKWINPDGGASKTETVPILSGQAEGSYKPNEPGVWLVEAHFNNGVVVREILSVPFMVIPESPIGGVALIGSSLAALGGFIFWKRRNGSSQPPSCA